MGFEPTTLCSLDRVLCQLSHRASLVDMGQISYTNTKQGKSSQPDKQVNSNSACHVCMITCNFTNVQGNTTELTRGSCFFRGKKLSLSENKLQDTFQIHTRTVCNVYSSTCYRSTSSVNQEPLSSQDVALKRRTWHLDRIAARVLSAIPSHSLPPSSLGRSHSTEATFMNS